MGPPCRPSPGRSSSCKCRRSRTASAEHLWVRDPEGRRRGLRGWLPGARAGAGRLEAGRGGVRAVRRVCRHRRGALHLRGVDDVRVRGDGGLGARELAPAVAEEGGGAAGEQEDDEERERDGGDRAGRELVLADGARAARGAGGVAYSVSTHMRSARAAGAESRSTASVRVVTARGRQSRLGRQREKIHGVYKAIQPDCLRRVAESTAGQITCRTPENSLRTWIPVGPKMMRGDT
ncbi:hypothetical protein GGX14DRAFT_473170 [Mycena pura]|uniref:Uncharacterized protein n=1 Tax=Mycena pura TaxID=153505 RepID=A0AAD6V0I4_9AGAR|nr:hypothetical protein GGX14DRAFT_473170 [Mycena pura]